MVIIVSTNVIIVSVWVIVISACVITITHISTCVRVESKRVIVVNMSSKEYLNNKVEKIKLKLNNPFAILELLKWTSQHKWSSEIITVEQWDWEITATMVEFIKTLQNN